MHTVWYNCLSLSIWATHCRHYYSITTIILWVGSYFMMTSSNGNIFRVTGPLCAGKSPVTGKFPSQRPVMGSFDVFFGLRLNKRLSQHSRHRWFEMPSCSLWRHDNAGFSCTWSPMSRTTISDCIFRQEISMCSSTTHYMWNIIVKFKDEITKLLAFVTQWIHIW